MKSLGPANDEGVPEDEFLLAQMLQNANARGLKWTSRTYFRNASGHPLMSSIISDPLRVGEIAACCAYGAGMLEPDTYSSIQLRGGMITGNDWGWGTLNEPFGDTEAIDLGCAFRDAMGGNDE